LVNGSINIQFEFILKWNSTGFGFIKRYVLISTINNTKYAYFIPILYYKYIDILNFFYSCLIIFVLTNLKNQMNKMDILKVFKNIYLPQMIKVSKSFFESHLYII